ncbi:MULTISPECIES: hypothetical protein [Methanobacterium]|jgi:hypothetical protein|uniref:Uncharacterized protein n=1 Tax=Methanobacterium veterum TaxID=408577 RepID=A0A9E5A3P6_9EURY|nr:MULTISPECIES: hypothetical protein [Methanobacterium]MCZ3366839.1 hypothetical protein [Methanobacterium veterum]MCZ3374014.1 hypothetical protein [Methanobacterium veterum]
MNEMGLFKNQSTHKNKKDENRYKDIIEEVNHCKGDDLESLLQKIESEIEKSDKKDKKLLSAKTMVTSRIAVRNSSK